jgi:tRNA pseudouridine38-40 synthase
MRACRTDKGVHAAGAVVSMKILIKIDLENKEEGCTDEDREEVALKATVIRLNNLLPSDIRIFAIKRTASSFHAKERCDSRFYEYLLPTYALAPASVEPYLDPTPKPFEEQRPAPTVAKKKGGDSDDEAEELERIEGGDEMKSEWISRLTEDEEKLIREYRVDADCVSKLREFMSKYVGSKKFHNFTIGKSFGDPFCRRNILSVTVGEPFMVKDIEWISVVFHGQSFMLHQIRKMVGLVILAVRLNCNLSIVEALCLQPSKVNIPKAPSLGLLLDKAIFTAYNEKFAGTRDTIDFDAFEEERKKLKAELIYPKIYTEEAQYNRFMGWLKCNDEHASEFGFLIPFINRPSQLQD